MENLKGMEHLKQARERRGLSQRDLSRLASVEQSVLSRLEAGISTDPRVSTAKRLAAALGVPVEKLFADV